MNISDKEFNLYGVVGSPIGHSKSPDIFNSIISKYNKKGRYIRLAVSDSSRIIPLCKELNIRGINITSPYKEVLFNELDSYDKISESLEAVNTISFENGSSIGFNSDSYGVYSSINRYDLKSRSILVIGGGGAAKSVLYALKKFNITITNRTESKGLKLATAFGVKFIQFSDIEKGVKKADIVISTLPDPEIVLKPQWFRKGSIFFDANYKSKFILPQTVNYISGKDWLINQAIPNLKRFFLLDVDYKEVLSNLEKVESKKNITLIGFMGCGKTTYGRKLAKKIGRSWIDLDSEIEKENGASICEIFEKYGEERFREIETKILERYSNIDNCLISCGGGIVESERNREILRSTYNIWIYLSFENCYNRIKNSKKRPLVGKDLRLIYERRIDLYSMVTDLLFDSFGDIEKGVDYLSKEIKVSGVI